ncbi:phage tail tube protein [Salinilacihabitans rarus]|uniref:phage tail tube protein n=1 Tax=Salinilacihabitans rarus TaxID=2961596 RepID=UPI0020C841DB|nr:phage tail tube protein [Salinilacihabitans rarus]
MTGAGSATVAYALEQTYGGSLVDEDSDGTPEWYQPGVDVTVGDLSVENALERIRQPDDPTPAGSREGNFEGAASVSFTLTDDNFHDLVFADGGTALPSSPMAAPSSTWYFGVDHVDGNEARTPTGAIVVDATINYQQGADVTVELTMLYGDEPDDVTAPSSITQPSDADVFTWHGADLTVDAVDQTLMQTASLSLSGLARFRRGQSRHPFDAVVGAIEPSLSTDATFTENAQLQAAYGGATTPQDTIGKVSGSLSFQNGQGTTISYDLTGLQPTSYGWNDLVNPDEDLSEAVEYHVADVAVV